MARGAAGDGGGAHPKGDVTTMVPDRWDGDVHHYDYSTSIERYPGMDAFKVAEAYLYAQPNPAIAYGIVVVVSAQALHANVRLELAIERGRALIHDRLAKDGEVHEHARTMRGSETHLYSWDGRYLGRVFPPPTRSAGTAEPA